MVNLLTSGGSRNFKTGGRGLGAVEFLGSGFVLMPFQTYPMFYSESREQSTYCKHCMMATIKYMRIMQSKFTNTTPQKIQTGGRAPVLDPPLIDAYLHWLFLVWS